jgi:hypothetical protein
VVAAVAVVQWAVLAQVPQPMELVPQLPVSMAVRVEPIVARIDKLGLCSP